MPTGDPELIPKPLPQSFFSPEHGRIKVLERELDRANELINKLYESGVLSSDEEELVQNYLAN